MERAQFALAERAGRVGYWRVGLPDLKIACSPGLYSVIGLSQSSGDLLQDVGPHLDGSPEFPRFLEAAEEAIRARSGFSYRRCIRCPDGVERDLDILGEIEIDPAGNAVAIVGATHDVTE